MLRIGAHLSVSRGLAAVVEEAKEIGANTVQLFWSSPRSWQLATRTEAETALFQKLVKEADIWPVVVHLPYLLNLASANQKVRQASVNTLNQSLTAAQQLGADYVVLHLGSHLGAGLEVGLNWFTLGLAEVLAETPQESPKILLENTAASTHALGHRFENIGQIIKNLSEDKRLGFCLDTCHAFVSGYDLATQEGIKKSLAELEKHIGLKRWLLTHANDSKGALGSGKDRHQHIGEGYIGEAGWRLLLAEPKFKARPLIIETPKINKEKDRQNIEKLKQLAEVASW